MFATLGEHRMKALAAACLIVLALPATALAEDAHIATVAVPVRGERGAASVRPSVFNLVGLHWRGSGTVLFQTRSTTGRWSAWRAAAPEAEDVPDVASPETTATRGWQIGSPWWVGAANAIRYRLRGEVRALRASFVASTASAVPLRTLSVAGSPTLVTRQVWRANESITKAPYYADAVRFALVHHTAGTNSYTPAQSAAIVRAIQLYHVRGNGWNDIGYNFLVDKFGQIFEGRSGGVDKPVVGAHAEGFNTGSVGVSVLGSYGGAGISPAALDAVDKLLAWRLDVAHVDPRSALSWLSGGNARFGAGTPVPLRAISAHRDTGFTDCPGNGLYRQLPTIAGATAELGLPKLYDPLAQGKPGTPVRFTARLSQPAVWTVTVTDGTGAAVATGRGEGVNVDWTWDATFASGTRYQYTIDAGPSFRPATGVVGQRVTALALTGVQAKPRTFTPNGDSQADSTIITYTLSLPATVTATLRDANGQTLATLFSELRKAGRQTFRFSAAGIADGRYTVVLVARDSVGKEVRAEIAIVIDRTLAAFAAAPAVFSPNGDGRLDTIAFTFVLTSAAHLKIRLAGGTTLFEGDLGPGQQKVPWTGKLRDGKYAAMIEVAGPFGPRSQTARFAVDTQKPRLRLISARSLRFWVSEPSTVVLTLDGRRLEQTATGYFTVRTAAAKRITALAFDSAGNRSARLRYP
jgi:N-acetylmuramoyl-L-alanine amidase-like protein